MKLGILQTDHVREPLWEEHGDYDAMFMGLFAGQLLDIQVYHALEGELPRSMNECDGYLITGSRFSSYDPEPWIENLKAWVVLAHHARCKLIGVCFGHQLIADALGGHVGPAETGWRVGVYPNKFTESWDSSLMHSTLEPEGSDNEQFNLLFSHQDQVLDMPLGAVLLASGEDCPCAMYMIDDHILCVQGHPEMNKAYVSDLLEMRRPVIGDDLVDHGLASLAMSTHQPRVARWMTSFLGARTASAVRADALLFDLDGTLVDREATMAAFLKMQWDEMPEISTVCERETFVSAVLSHQEGGYAAKSNTYESALSSLEFDAALIDRLVPELVHHLDAFYGSTAALFPGVTSMLEDLSKQFRLALITNGNTACQQRKLQATDLSHFFEVIAISQDLGEKKPSPGIFRHCFETLGVSPEVVVMIGDNPENDISGARALGCMTVLVNNGENGQSDIQTDQALNNISELPVALRRMGLVDG